VKVVFQALAQAAAGPEGATDMEDLAFGVIDYIDAMICGGVQASALGREVRYFGAEEFSKEVLDCLGGGHISIETIFLLAFLKSVRTAFQYFNRTLPYRRIT
jgi:hypothetical protein